MIEVQQSRKAGTNLGHAVGVRKDRRDYLSIEVLRQHAAREYPGSVLKVKHDTIPQLQSRVPTLIRSSRYAALKKSVPLPPITAPPPGQRYKMNLALGRRV